MKFRAHKSPPFVLNEDRASITAASKNIKQPIKAIPPTLPITPNVNPLVAD